MASLFVRPARWRHPEALGRRMLHHPALWEQVCDWDQDLQGLMGGSDKQWVAKECDKREVEWGWRREHLAWKLLLYNKVSLCFSFLFPSPLPPASETWIFEFHSLVVWTFRSQPEWVIATYLLQYSVVALVLLTNVSLLTTDLLSFICSVVEFVPLLYLLLDFIVVAVSHRPLEGVCKVLLIVLNIPERLSRRWLTILHVVVKEHKPPCWCYSTVTPQQHFSTGGSPP